MPNTTMKTQIQVRRDTTANWLANKDVVPAAGEPCFDLELGTLKIGDGVTTYENLKAISGASAAHYEGVKAEGESDNDVITRVLTAAGVTAEKDDIFVVKSLIADGKYSYTAYVYDGSVWAAMDGNYSAENVYFADDLTYTAAIGVLTVPSSGSGTIAASGKNVKDVLASILAKEKNPTATQPAVTITCKQIAAYEVGSKVTPAYTASLSAGSYTYGPATGITATAWSVTDGTATKDTASGSFDELTVGDATSYAITATATHGEGAVPVTNLGNEYAAGKIAAGNKSKATGKITGYRNSFYGTLEAKDGEVNSALVRSLSGKSGKALAAGNSFNLAIPVGAIRVVFAYPATLRDVNSVQDVNGMNAEVKTAFTKTVVSVEGANGYQAIDYTTLEGYGITDAMTATAIAEAIKTAIAETGHASFTKVDAVPAASEAKDNVLYLVMNADTGFYDIYAKVGTEVVRLDDVSVNLDNYSTTEQMNEAIATAIANKVDKVDGKGLSTEDFTTALKEKLVALPEGAEANYVKSVSDEFTVSAEGKLEVKEVAPAKVTGLPDALSGKVDKVAGKGLSANDYTDEEKEKLGGVEAGANKNLIEIIKLAGAALNISEKAVNIPFAGDTAGVVTSSTGENKVAVAEDGSMEVNSLNMNKLVQSDGDTLILDGGNAAV